MAWPSRMIGRCRSRASRAAHLALVAAGLPAENAQSPVLRSPQLAPNGGYLRIGRGPAPVTERDPISVSERERAADSARMKGRASCEVRVRGSSQSGRTIRLSGLLAARQVWPGSSCLMSRADKEMFRIWGAPRPARSGLGLIAAGKIEFSAIGRIVRRAVAVGCLRDDFDAGDFVLLGPGAMANMAGTGDWRGRVAFMFDGIGGSERWPAWSSCAPGGSGCGQPVVWDLRF